MRNIYYINKKLGFYGTGESKSSGGQRSPGRNGKKFNDEGNDRREVRDTSSSFHERPKRPFTNDNQINFDEDDPLGLKRRSKWYDRSQITGRNLDELPPAYHYDQHHDGSGGKEIQDYWAPDELLTTSDMTGYISDGGGILNVHDGKDKLQYPGEKREDGSDKDLRSDKTYNDEEMFIGLEETYGVVYCWGENLQGKQQQPCVMTITPAGELMG